MNSAALLTLGLFWYLYGPSVEMKRNTVFDTAAHVTGLEVPKFAKFVSEHILSKHPDSDVDENNGRTGELILLPFGKVSTGYLHVGWQLIFAYRDVSNIFQRRLIERQAFPLNFWLATPPASVMSPSKFSGWRLTGVQNDYVDFGFPRGGYIGRTGREEQSGRTSRLIPQHPSLSHPAVPVSDT